MRAETGPMRFKGVCTAWDCDDLAVVEVTSDDLRGWHPACRKCADAELKESVGAKERPLDAKQAE